MKKLLIIFLCLLPMLASADYLVFWLNRNASQADKSKVRSAIRTILNDTSDLDVDLLPVYRYIPNTNITGWILVADLEQVRRFNSDTGTNIQQRFNNWKAANMDNPNHFRVDKDAWWESVILTNKLERVGP